MLPVNRVENCKRVLEQGKYQLMDIGPQYKGVEDLWLIKYLQEQGKTKKEIFNMLSPIHEEAFGGWSCRLYDSYYTRAKKVNIHKYEKTAIIYEDELYKINHMRVPITQKQFALCVLCFLKSGDNRGVGYNDIMCSGIKCFVKRPDRHDEYDFSLAVNAMLECGILYKDEIKIYDSFSDDFDTFERIYVGKSESKKSAFSVVSIIDIHKYYKNIKNYIKCEKCGLEFVARERCQRNICKDCWEEIKNQRNSEKTIKICRQCGKEFEAGPKCQRNICYDCWLAKKNQRNGTYKIKTCLNCGNEFKAGPKCQRNICYDCWLAKKNQRNNKTKNIICAECGEEFFASAKCKRNLCDICYKRVRNKIKNLKKYS